jgi:hypothetical protein
MAAMLCVLARSGMGDDKVSALDDFLEARTDPTGDARAPVRALHALYVGYCKERGEYAAGEKSFNDQLRERRWQTVRNRSGDSWVGLGLEPASAREETLEEFLARLQAQRDAWDSHVAACLVDGSWTCPPYERPALDERGLGDWPGLISNDKLNARYYAEDTPDEVGPRDPHRSIESDGHECSLWYEHSRNYRARRDYAEWLAGWQGVQPWEAAAEATELARLRAL